MQSDIHALGSGSGRPGSLGLWTILREDVRANVIQPSAWRAVTSLVYSPGLLCVVLHRVTAWAVERGKLGWLFGILVWRFNVFATGAYLHPKAAIGPGLCLPHPVGVVVGSGVRLGANVTLYQGATIGVSSQEHYETYPTIQDNVVIYCGAVVVGGVNVGSNAVVGANAVVLRDIPAGTTAVGIPARIIGLPARAS